MKILIIEDVLSHLQEMSNMLTLHGHEVKPDEDDYDLLKEEISRCFQRGVTTAIAREAAEYIRKYILDFDPDLILVDFELKENTPLVNGKRFIEAFLSGRNFIIVTGQKKLAVNNVLDEVVEKARPNSKGMICWKHDPMDEKFLERLLAKVTQFELPASHDPQVNFGTTTS